MRRLVIIDQINPQWAKYYRRGEIETMVRGAGFVDVRAHHRHSYSWTVVGPVFLARSDQGRLRFSSHL
jgi:hypothetical protein